jgi:predicted  nucleic acid-binding Zn-ribbon protein
MFRCERCGSSYSAAHAVALENCPRCEAREQVASRLVFKPFQLADGAEPKLRSVPLTVASEQAAQPPGDGRETGRESLSQPG